MPTHSVSNSSNSFLYGGQTYVNSHNVIYNDTSSGTATKYAINLQKYSMLSPELLPLVDKLLTKVLDANPDYVINTIAFKTLLLYDILMDSDSLERITKIDSVLQ
jgi:hypothetical protein